LKANQKKKKKGDDNLKERERKKIQEKDSFQRRGRCHSFWGSFPKGQKGGLRVKERGKNGWEAATRKASPPSRRRGGGTARGSTCHARGKEKKRFPGGGEERRPLGGALEGKKKERRESFVGGQVGKKKEGRTLGFGQKNTHRKGQEKEREKGNPGGLEDQKIKKVIF